MGQTTAYLLKLCIWIYRSFMDNINSVPLFGVVLIIFMLEACMMKSLKKRFSYKTLSGAGICVAFVVSMVVFFSASMSLLESKLVLGTEVNLISRTEEMADHTKSWILKEYYFRDKQVQLDGYLRSDNSISDVINEEKILNDECKIITNTQEAMLLSQPFFSDDGYFFVVDYYWESTKEIVSTKIENRYIFCSRECLEEILQGELTCGTSNMENAEQVMSRIINEKVSKWNDLKQIIILFGLYIIGLFFSYAFWGEYDRWVSVFMALPIGAGGWCISSICLVTCNVKCCIFTNALLIGCVIVGTGVWAKRHTAKWDWRFMIKVSCLVLCTIIALTFLKISWMTNDSFSKAGFGLQIAITGSLGSPSSFTRATSFGLLEPFIMALAYEIHAEYIYAFYPLMTISCMGLMISTMKKDCNRIWMILTAQIITLLNVDFLLGSFYVMAHGPIALYFLIFLSFIVLKREKNIPYADIAIAFSAIIIILTRIEGAVYIVALLALYLGLSDDRFSLSKTSYIISGVIILWNVAQILLVREGYDILFWTPQRGVLLIVAALILLMWSWIVQKRWWILEHIKANFQYLFLILLCIGTIIVMGIVKPDMAKETFPVYIAHFSNNLNNETNAAAFWTFILLMLPCVSMFKMKTNSYVVISVITYLVLIYFICLFRSDVPIRLGYGDSARRTIVQIMPSAVWMIIYAVENARKQLEENRGENEYGS